MRALQSATEQVAAYAKGKLSFHECHTGGLVNNTIDEYLESRFRTKLEWYDRRAVTRKRLYLGLEYFSAITSVLLVVLLHVDEMPRLVLAVMAAAVSIAVTTERIGQFGRLWQLYRLTAEQLTSEQQHYLHRSGAYSSVGNNIDALFVQRVEQILGGEASNWHQAVVSARDAAIEARLPTER